MLDRECDLRQVTSSLGTQFSHLLKKTKTAKQTNKQKKLQRLIRRLLGSFPTPHSKKKKKTLPRGDYEVVRSLSGSLIHLEYSVEPRRQLDTST